MIGYFTVVLSLVLTAFSVYFYYRVGKEQVDRLGKGLRQGLTCYLAAAGSIGVAAAYLLYLIVSDQFQFAYVFNYSSRDLSMAYKLSVFWAGQQGSFLLWVVIHALFGITLLRKGSATTPGTMAIYGILQMVLLLMLLVKSPFMMLASTPPDGNGLNPLLQDPWMVIHPPLVFLGYAGLAVPYALAIDGLLNKRHNWITSALPWTLMSWTMLGAGIFVGGYWAYKVLGWGGYWAWDPVENSSLVPWLATGALVHLLVLAKIRTAAVKPSYFAVVSAYLLVLYATYLTRSGILSDFSTHSFADEGVGGILAGIIMVAAVASIFALIVRWPGLPEGAIYVSVRSREFVLACTALVFAAIAVLVFVGMSTPLFTQALGKAQSVGASFYNKATLPLGIIIAILLTVGPLWRWGPNGGMRKQLIGLGVTAATSFWAALSLGLSQPAMALLAACSATAVLVNIGMALFNRKLTWAGITHGGVGLLLVGIVGSSVAGVNTTLSFEPNTTYEVFGRKLTYSGVEKQTDGKGFYQNFKLEDRGGAHLVQPYTKLNKDGHDAAREPGIYRTMLTDIYLAPVHKHQENPVQEIVVYKGEQQTKDGISLKLVRLNMVGRDGGGDIRVRAVLDVTMNGKTEEAIPEIVYHQSGRVTGDPVRVFDQYKIMLGGVNPAKESALVGLQSLQPVVDDGRIDVDISTKPLINLVWLGTLLITIGTAWAALARTVLRKQVNINNDQHNSIV